VTVQRLTNAEMEQDEYKTRMRDFDQHLDERLDIIHADPSHEPSDIPDWNRLSLDELDPEFDAEFNKIINDEGVPEADEEQKKYEKEDSKPESSSDAFDPYLGMEVGLPRGDDDRIYHARIKRRAVDREGELIGIESKNR
jgi:hypothetical protein